MKTMIKASALLAGLLFASSAFAATTITSAGITFSNGTFKPSNNVTILASTDTAGTKYNAGSKHLSGDREYARTSQDPKYYWKAANVGTGTPTFGGDATSTIDTSWTAQ